MGCCGDAGPALVFRGSGAYRTPETSETARDVAVTNALIFGLILFGVLLLLGVL